MAKKVNKERISKVMMDFHTGKLTFRGKPVQSRDEAKKIALKNPSK